ncbi:hypothetical protein ACFE04_003952 [Oxalis oulophora]
MEATKDQRLIDILPPRIEDAGLEDCALPPDSIKEAFLKAATAVKSRASSLFATASEDEEEDEHDCINDPWLIAKDVTDTIIAGKGSPLPESDVLVVGGLPEEHGPCTVEKNSGVVEEGKDKVVVGGGEVADVDEREDCVGGGGGVKGSKKNKVKGENGDDEEKPILAEGFV